MASYRNSAKRQILTVLSNLPPKHAASAKAIAKILGMSEEAVLMGLRRYVLNDLVSGFRFQGRRGQGSRARHWVISDKGRRRLRWLMATEENYDDD